MGYRKLLGHALVGNSTEVVFILWLEGGGVRRWKKGKLKKERTKENTDRGGNRTPDFRFENFYAQFSSTAHAQ